MSAPMNAEKRQKRNKMAGYIAIISGILLLVSGVTGAEAWSALGETIEDIVGGDMGSNIKIVFMVLSVIALLGGILVLLGGILFIKEKITGGKVAIAIGVGMGLIGLIIILGLAAWTLSKGDVDGFIARISLLGSTGGIGILLSIIARLMATKPE